MKSFFRIVLLLLFTSVCFSQDKKFSFDNVDQKVLILPPFNSADIGQLSALLTKDFSAQAEKVRAIYIWVANNISYNVPKYAERKNQQDILQTKKDIREAAENIMQKRIAVCEGYSNLVKALCDKAGITCTVIEGIGRAEANKNDLHAWNAVKMDGEWKLLDATWAAGGINAGNNKFEKHFDDSFFMIPPAEFIKTHYPFDPMWQLLQHPVTRKEFEQSKNSSAGTFVFYFNDTITNFYLEDSISQMIALNRRTYEYDPANDFAKMNMMNVSEYSESQKMTGAAAVFTEGAKQFNTCTDIINEARKKRSTKKLNENEAVLKQLVKDSRTNISKSLELYNSIKFSGNENTRVLKMNVENCKESLMQLDQIEKYLNNYFSTPEINRSSVL